MWAHESNCWYSAYSALTTGIQVKCPKCHGAGVVTADDENAYFRCLSCGHRMIQDRTVYRCDVHNQCRNCGRYYRVDIETGEPCLWITDPDQIGMPKMEFVGGHPDEYCIFLKNLTETELAQITSLDGAPLEAKNELR